MDDFGKILDKWDNRQTRSKRPSASQDMTSWIDRYPPEYQDHEHEQTPTHTRRRNPEKMKVEASLDLHGHRLDEALAATDRFIEESLSQGHRKVVIVHGKGENGQGILRREIRTHLERNPMTGAMGYSRGAEGGRGALWVVLRERRETNRAPEL